MTLDAWGATDTGAVRGANEDAFLLKPSLFAVADGMGGKAGGAEASSAAIEAIVKRLRGRAGNERALRRAFTEAQRNVRRLDPDQEIGLGTTLTVAGILGNRLYLGHIGDSRAYLLRNGELTRFTTDHSWVAEMVRSGEISESEAERHPQRNILTRALGPHEEIEAEFRDIPIQEGDVILLCTDGLSGVLDESDIRRHLSRREGARAICGRLIDEVIGRGAPDNVSAVVIRVEDDDPPALWGIGPLLTIGLALAAGAMALAAAVEADPGEYLGLIGWFILAAGALVVVTRFTGNYDPILLPCALGLTALGIILQLSISPERAALQLRWVGVSLALFALLLFTLRDHRALTRYKYLTAMLGLLLLLAPIFVGEERFGAKLWLQLGPFSFQPGEIAKILLAVFFAAYLSERRELLGGSGRRWGPLELPPLRHSGPLLLMWAVSLLILVFERDLGSSLLFFGLFALMLFTATGRMLYPIAGTFLFIAGAALSYQTFSHVATRVDVWLNPWDDPAGKGYQLVQSLFAIAGGGILGRGLGHGQPELLPAASTDLIFAVLAEEIGLVGVALLFFLYILFLVRGFGLALRARDSFSKLLAIGLTTALSLQSLIIMGGVTGAVPLTGVTLPFVSYGGSSLLTNFLLLGLLLKIGKGARG